MTSFRVPFAALLTALLVSPLAQSLDAQLRLSPAERLTVITEQFPCRTYPFTIELLGKNTFRGAACSLVGLAMRELASERGRTLGLSGLDSSRVIFAYAYAVSFDAFDSTGTTRLPALDEAYWSVTFQLSGREAAVEIKVDQKTGKVKVINTEPVASYRLKKPDTTSSDSERTGEATGIAKRSGLLR